MSKPRRRVTVENSKSLSDATEKKKSVFERLGPGGGGSSRNFEQERQERCRNWLSKSGSYGQSRHYKQYPQSSSRDHSPEDLRHKVTRKRDKSDECRENLENESDSDQEKQQLSQNLKSQSHSRKDKESKLKSTVVVTKQRSPDTGEDSEQEWGSQEEHLNELDFNEELMLEKERQKLQRKLRELQEEEEKEQSEHIYIEKQVGSITSDDSDQESMPIPEKSKKKSRLQTPPNADDSPKKKHSAKEKKKNKGLKTKGPRTPSPGEARAKERRSRFDDKEHRSRHKSPNRYQSESSPQRDKDSPPPRRQQQSNPSPEPPVTKQESRRRRSPEYEKPSKKSSKRSVTPEERYTKPKRSESFKDARSKRSVSPYADNSRTKRSVSPDDRDLPRRYADTPPSDSRGRRHHSPEESQLAKKSVDRRGKNQEGEGRYEVERDRNREADRDTERGRNDRRESLERWRNKDEKVRDRGRSDESRRHVSPDSHQETNRKRSQLTSSPVSHDSRKRDRSPDGKSSSRRGVSIDRDKERDGKQGKSWSKKHSSPEVAPHSGQSRKHVSLSPPRMKKALSSEPEESSCRPKHSPLKAESRYRKQGSMDRRAVSPESRSRGSSPASYHGRSPPTRRGKVSPPNSRGRGQSPVKHSDRSRNRDRDEERDYDRMPSTQHGGRSVRNASPPTLSKGRMVSPSSSRGGGRAASSPSRECIVSPPRGRGSSPPHRGARAQSPPPPLPPNKDYRGRRSPPPIRPGMSPTPDSGRRRPPSPPQQFREGYDGHARGTYSPQRRSSPPPPRGGQHGYMRYPEDDHMMDMHYRPDERAGDRYDDRGSYDRGERYDQRYPPPPDRQDRYLDERMLPGRRDDVRDMNMYDRQPPEYNQLQGKRNRGRGRGADRGGRGRHTARNAGRQGGRAEPLPPDEYRDEWYGQANQVGRDRQGRRGDWDNLPPEDIYPDHRHDPRDRRYDEDDREMRGSGNRDMREAGRDTRDMRGMRGRDLRDAGNRRNVGMRDMRDPAGRQIRGNDMRDTGRDMQGSGMRDQGRDMRDPGWGEMHDIWPQNSRDNMRDVRGRNRDMRKDVRDWDNRDMRDPRDITRGDGRDMRRDVPDPREVCDARDQQDRSLVDRREDFRKRQYPDDLSRSPNPKRRREASPSGGPRRRDTSPSGMLYRRANSPTALQRRRANSPTNVARRQEGSPSESQHSSQSRERMERDQRYQRTPEFGRERQVYGEKVDTARKDKSLEDSKRKRSASNDRQQDGRDRDCKRMRDDDYGKEKVDGGSRHVTPTPDGGLQRVKQGDRISGTEFSDLSDDDLDVNVSASQKDGRQGPSAEASLNVVDRRDRHRCSPSHSSLGSRRNEDVWDDRTESSRSRTRDQDRSKEREKSRDLEKDREKGRERDNNARREKLPSGKGKAEKINIKREITDRSSRERDSDKSSETKSRSRDADKVKEKDIDRERLDINQETERISVKVEKLRDLESGKEHMRESNRFARSRERDRDTTKSRDRDNNENQDSVDRVQALQKQRESGHSRDTDNREKTYERKCDEDRSRDGDAERFRDRIEASRSLPRDNVPPLMERFVEKTQDSDNEPPPRELDKDRVRDWGNTEQDLDPDPRQDGTEWSSEWSWDHERSWERGGDRDCGSRDNDRSRGGRLSDRGHRDGKNGRSGDRDRGKEDRDSKPLRGSRTDSGSEKGDIEVKNEQNRQEMKETVENSTISEETTITATEEALNSLGVEAISSPEASPGGATGAIEYEAISEDEIELEPLTRADEEDMEQTDETADSKTAVDALDIDWHSLVKNSAPKPSPAKSALRRFHPANIFARIGVSRQFAGDTLFDKIQNMCQEHFSIESGSSIDGGSNENKLGDGPFRFLHDVAALHANAVVRKKQRAKLFTDIGPYRRALCSSRDLYNRKQLCKPDKSSDPGLSFQSHAVDPELYKLSQQIFRKARGTVDTNTVQPAPEMEPVAS